MIDDEAAVVTLLEGLARSDSDALRSDRVRARCHRVLARRQTLVVRSRPGRSQAWRVLESAIVGGFCTVYLTLIALIALQSRGFF